MMLRKWKARIVAGLFVLGAFGFFLALLPGLSSVFWPLWLASCIACIFGLVFAFTLPSATPADALPRA
jgi:hypothetical protein